MPALVFHGGACIDGTCYVLDSVTSGTNTLYECVPVLLVPLLVLRGLPAT